MNDYMTLSKRIEFSASHRYWNDEWSEEENIKNFGKCTSKFGHGHNYVLETTVKGLSVILNQKIKIFQFSK